MSATAGPWVRVDAPAKVNLRLRVLGPRPDGYHAVDTVMLAIDLLDEVAVRIAPGGAVRLEASGGARGEELPEPRRNLARHGALGVLERARARGLVDGTVGLDVRLTKRIPVEAGLGGASADAAAAALAARGALASSRGELPDAELRAVLAEVGSDCVFFLDARATGLARCTGRGEIVLPIEAPTPWHLLLVVPDVRCPTSSVYGALGGAWEAAPEAAAEDPEAWIGLPPEPLRARLVNDLEPAALTVRPELARWREVFAACHAEHLLLSGSGSAFFGLYGEEEAAERDGEAIERRAVEAGLSARAVRVVRPTGAGLLPRSSN
ncbi:MAG: hypothetical protein O7B99_00755 [Planctomycetota bacterium]|nr:hypothetical protein [Planctomycetota bacterium]